MNPRIRQVVATALASLSLMAGVGAVSLFAYPFYTDFMAGRTQRALRDAFDSEKLKEAYREKRLVDGNALTRIIIPAMGTDAMVVEGISQKALNTGAGHYPMTPLPGEPGNVAIAGHRTTYGKPFARQEVLRPGDKIFLVTPFARYTYVVVMNPWVVAYNDWSIVEPTPESMLTLTTCHPRGSDAQRLVARAKLFDSEPVA